MSEQTKQTIAVGGGALLAAYIAQRLGAHALVAAMVGLGAAFGADWAIRHYLWSRYGGVSEETETAPPASRTGLAGARNILRASAGIGGL